MSIIGKFKRLIFGTSAEPVVQVPLRTVPQPEQAQSSKAGDNEPRFSESDMLAVQQRAETVQRAFNESLGIANQSKNRGTREYRLQVAREWLIELKKLANKFPFLQLTNLQAVEASIIAVEAETRSLPYNEVLVRYVADNVDSSVTSASCWVKPGTEILAKGLTIPGGMLYYGKGLARVTGAGIEPALINPGLPVNMPAGSLEQMPYWLSYSDISPTARGGYLQWLAGGRKDPNVQIGYVFLFFYGLERRVLADARQYPEVAQELPAVLAEVRRLLSIYENQGSFYGYASRFLDLVVTVGAKDRIYKLPPLPQGQYKALTLRHKIALGQAAVDGALLPAAWAYSWLINDERFYPRTPACRCRDEFKKLFLDAYAEKFDQGLKLPVNKTKLKALYKPASASFGYGQVELTGADIPDITVLEGPLNRLREIAESATAQLEPYSRYVGRNPEKKGSRDAMVLLPPELWPAENLHSLTSWLVKLGADGAAQVATFGELMQHFSAGAAPKKDGYLALASGLEQLGVGIEPDVRWGGPLPSEGSKVVLFPISVGERTTKPSPPYSAAILTLHLAAAVIAADGEVSAQEEEYLEKQLGRWIHLGAAEFSRLRAHLKWLLLSPPSLTTLKKRVSVLTDDQKRAIAEFLIALAQAEGGVSPAEINVLTKVYRLFGLDEKVLYSQAHTAATEPVTVKHSAPALTGFGVPPQPTPRPIGAIVLDHERIATLTADSERISAILSAIFTDEVQPAEPVVPAEPEVTPTGVSIVRLDASYSELVRVLVSRDAWTRAELEDLASDRGIMLDGALDHINEAFLDAHNEHLLEGEDPVEINKNIAKELEVV
ncbi:MAG: hypothetical protein A3H31_03105 [Gallionellales bacterium RIFCSPLOWO2_02_FULL_57_47]|nr:MAG: hypothetical protein A3H31_03105 [Gallionellales bacterium RIFCSPLOWO2_02_FULL_57_47]OGT18283.1 MAG: hypothetical protein A3J49_03710 [Gallionellales bacterium RIFCSPHIGHO2_02_FULL_57_16]